MPGSAYEAALGASTLHRGSFQRMIEIARFSAFTD
jgi:hypothetical protein